MQTALFAPRVAQYYNTAISTFWGLAGAPIIWQGIPVLPGSPSGQDCGNSFLLQHAKHWFEGDVRNGLVFTLMDVWPMNTRMAATVKMCCWAPVDHDPVMPGVANFFMDSGAVPIAMSRFGEEQLRHAGLDPLYCPHGVDTNVYKPWDKQVVRKAGNIPQDAFFVGVVAANKGTPSRKGFAQALQAFAIFREKHDDALLYLHTVVDPNYASGEDIMAIVNALGIKDAVCLAPTYRLIYNPFSSEELARMYSAFDVLLNCSWGEGFGIPILEAAATGVPAIVTNFTAMPEVAGPGWVVGCRKHWTPGKSWMAIPDVEEMVAALEECYGLSDEERKTLSTKCRNHALAYDADKVFSDYMLPALSEVEERLGPGTKTLHVPEPVAVSGKLAVER
jgi:hypothetical protein